MPPIYVKGGVWTNVEDQILKAAVSKYGLNQWDRVSSLLPKKSAKQAKARWAEYLNPSLNRTEWSREDDQKLLRLAKLVPNQWRTIAPMMARTAASCVDRYQQLLDEAGGIKLHTDAEGREIGLELSGPGIESLPSAGHAVGDMNTNPESKPARPDDEDMDEEEREMLSEAKGRLANTQGKKAQRKARERMLEETRRISQVQKRRELKAAGINVSLSSKNKRKRGEFDHGDDIYNEIVPQSGLYDTLEEDEANSLEKAQFERLVASKGIISDQKATKTKQKNEKRSRQVDSGVSSIGGNEVLVQPVSKRPKLELPEAGQRDVEVDVEAQIAKATQEIRSTQALESSLIVKNVENESWRGPELSYDVKAAERKYKKAAKPQPSFCKVITKLFAGLPVAKHNQENAVSDIGPWSGSMDGKLDGEVNNFGHREVETVDKGEHYRLLRENREKKEKLALKWDSPVVQKNLPLINPVQLKSSSATSELDKLIAAEVGRLVLVDYYKDDPASLEPLGQQRLIILETIARHIDQKESNGVDRSIGSNHSNRPDGSKEAIIGQNSRAELDQLPQTFQAAEKVIEELHVLHNVNTKLEEAIEAKNGGLQEKQRQLMDEILVSHAEIQQLDTDLVVGEAMAAAEAGGLQVTLDRWKSVVELLIVAETRIKKKSMT